MKIKDVMVRLVVTVGPGETVLAAATKMAWKGTSALVGVITECDLARKLIAAKRDPNNTKILELMSKPLFSVSRR